MSVENAEKREYRPIGPAMLSYATRCSGPESQFG
jgi:hypothetical protein